MNKRQLDKFKLWTAEFIIASVLCGTFYWVRHRVNAKITQDTRVANALERLAHSLDDR